MRIRALCCVGLGLLAVGLAAVPSEGIVRRHDRDDGAYKEKAVPFDTVVRLGGACGTLVGDRWVLTAAHVASGMGGPFATASLHGKAVRIDGIAMHPTWTGEGSARSVDMALIRLAEPVDNVEPSPLYAWGDEAGKPVVFVGWGMYGTGQDGPEGDDGVKRAATNTLIDAPAEGWVRFEFSRPPDATEFEGISGPGDSGGPAFIERDGAWHIAGVSSSNDGGGDGVCRYGSTEYYARVSASLDWIRGTIESGEVEPVSAPVVREVERAGWPGAAAGVVAEAFYTAYNSS